MLELHFIRREDLPCQQLLLEEADQIVEAAVGLGVGRSFRPAQRLKRKLRSEGFDRLVRLFALSERGTAELGHESRQAAGKVVIRVGLLAGVPLRGLSLRPLTDRQAQQQCQREASCVHFLLHSSENDDAVQETIMPGAVHHASAIR